MPDPGHHRRRRHSLTQRNNAAESADDLVNRNFDPAEPDRLWVMDITEHPTPEGKIYLAAVLDAYSRRVVGWSIGDHIRAELVDNQPVRHNGGSSLGRQPSPGTPRPHHLLEPAPARTARHRALRHTPPHRSVDQQRSIAKAQGAPNAPLPLVRVIRPTRCNGLIKEYKNAA